MSLKSDRLELGFSIHTNGLNTDWWWPMSIQTKSGNNVADERNHIKDSGDNMEYVALFNILLRLKTSICFMKNKNRTFTSFDADKEYNRIKVGP